MLIDAESLNQIDKNIEKIVPIIYSELSYVLKKDSTMSFDSLTNNIDNRISYLVLEKIIAKYPENFIEVSTNDAVNNACYSSIKRIK
jgi:hypothetical protein